MAQSGVVEPQEFESQWLKMLEEDEDANSLADDFSSSLRCDDMTLQALDEEEEEYFEDDEPTSSELDSGHEGSSGLTFGDIQFERIMAEFNNKEKNVKSELQSSVSPVIFENTTSSVQQTTTTKIETTTKITTITPKTEIPISPSKAHKRTHDLIESPSRFQLRPISSQPSSQDENVFKVPSRTASRSSSVCSRFTAERPPKSFRKAPEYESDEMVITRRQKQIDFGKNTVGYDEYLRAVPRENRSRDDPTTPDKYLKYSRRSFDQQIKNWRKQLHEFDPNGLKIVNNPLVKVEEVAEMDPEAQKLANIKKMLDFDYKPSSSLPAPAMVKKEVSEIDCSDILDDADFEL